MFADPHFAARNAIVTVPHPDFGQLPMQNVVPKLSATPGAVRTAGPALGEHNDQVWGELAGLGPAELTRLRAAAVI
jgi:formyl-CoA transferase